MPKRPTHPTTRTKPGLRRLLGRIIVFVAVPVVLFWSFQKPKILAYIDGDNRPHTLLDLDIGEAKQTAAKYVKEPIQWPYGDNFGEVGRRLRSAGGWLIHLDRLNSRAASRHDILSVVEATITALVPFLGATSKHAPVHDLLASFEPRSRGIIIPVLGDGDVRLVGHLITSLRVVFECKLPIQIAHAGDEGLSPRDRNFIATLESATDVSFLDVLSVFDGSALSPVGDRWVLKPFAALASRFEQVILADPDTVFIQNPDVLFDQQGYIHHGAFLFHDRNLDQKDSLDKHSWLKSQVKESSIVLSRNKKEGGSQSGHHDMGVLILNKSRVDVLMGILHSSWQSTFAVRDEIASKLDLGQDSLWLGLELVGSSYATEGHYASMIGWEGRQAGADQVCGPAVAHVDDNDNLLWYSGGLAKNTAVDPQDYQIPEAWMMDGHWKKDAKAGKSMCMVGKQMRPLRKLERKAVELTIEAAERVDDFLRRR